MWQAWLEQIKNTTDCYGNLMTVARDKLNQDFWDHPTIAQILSEAWHVTLFEPIEAQVAASVKSKIDLLSTENLVLSRGMPKKRISVQKLAYPKFSGSYIQTVLLQRRRQKSLAEILTQIPWHPHSYL